MSGAAPPRGLALSMLGVSSHDAAVAFYRDVLGLDPIGTVDWAGPAVEEHLGLAAGTRARASLLGYPGSELGRILVVDFDVAARQPVRAGGERVFLGLANLNFYTLDAIAAHGLLTELGLEAWTEPVPYEVGDGEGTPVEVIVEGPDGVLFNLVEPDGPPGSPVRDVRIALEQHGTTRTGFSEVVTTAHGVRSCDEAMRFYERVLGLEVWLDATFDRPESNRLLSLPDGAVSRVVFLKGDGLFGKVVLIEGLSYRPVDLVARAAPPGIGYLAMGFLVASLAEAREACRAVGAEIASEPALLDFPGYGECQSLLVRTPGSGALTQLLEVG